MNYIELLEIAKNNKIIIHSYEAGKFIRNKYVYSKEKDILDEKLIRIEKVNYTKRHYFARTENMKKHSMYKITAKEYKSFLEAGAKVE